MSLRIHVEINGRVVGRAVVGNVSQLADISDYDVFWSEEASEVSGLAERAGTASVEGHPRRQSVWALVEKVAGIAKGEAG